MSWSYPKSEHGSLRLPSSCLERVLREVRRSFCEVGKRDESGSVDSFEVASRQQDCSRRAVCRERMQTKMPETMKPTERRCVIPPLATDDLKVEALALS